MTKAVAYLRVSGASQLDGNGFERQLDSITAYAAAHAMEIIHVYREEAVSGKTEMEARPAFMAMLADLLANGCRTIIIERMDRLARELLIQEQILLFLARKDLALISADTGENITAAIKKDPARKAMIQMLGVFAEFDKGTLVDKLRKARAAKRAKGGFPGGNMPYGYAPERATEEEIVRANYERAVAERIREARRQGYTYEAIRKGLEAEGLMPRKGGKWQLSTIRQIAGGK